MSGHRLRSDAGLPFEVVDSAVVSDATVFTCPLCGGCFTHAGQVCHGCPLARGCDLVRCPHCAYQYPRSSRIASWFARRFGRPGPGGPVSLTPVEPLVQPLDRLGIGQSARIAFVVPREPGLMVRLAHLGVVPGALIHMQQRSPAAVLRVGETTFAVEPRVASDIYVKSVGW